MRAGEAVESVAAASGVTSRSVFRWLADAGGMPIEWSHRSPLRLSLAEREEIRVGLEQGRSFRAIEGQLGRAPSTISREVGANGGRDGYRAVRADRRAHDQARRPKTAKLARCGRLRAFVEAGLQRWWSPQQIHTKLIDMFPDDAEMRISHETIYQSLFVQSRGALRRELTACLRSGRTKRRPIARAAASQRGRIRGMVMISQRPAEADDRAVPGHWEGDLIMGANNKSAVATLVERTTRYVMLLALPGGRHTADVVADVLAAGVQRLPEHLWRSLTWDQGSEMADHQRFTIATGIPVYFCEPHSPWMRGSNENTNGLIRQYLPKGISLRNVTQDHLDDIGISLNARPRQTLNWQTPAEALDLLLR
jgi:IS30 family transposase